MAELAQLAMYPPAMLAVVDVVPKCVVSRPDSHLAFPSRCRND